MLNGRFKNESYVDKSLAHKNDSWRRLIKLGNNMNTAIKTGIVANTGIHPLNGFTPTSPYNFMVSC